MAKNKIRKLKLRFLWERICCNIYKVIFFRRFGINKTAYLTYFDKIYKKKLSKGVLIEGKPVDRFIGFRKIFEILLDKKAGDFTIIETGTLRNPGKWTDGQSSLLFYEFLSIFGGKLISLDLSQQNLKTCQKTLLAGVLCARKAALVLLAGDSLVELKKIDGEADLLYLDSYDLDLNDPEPSMAHHLKEVDSAAGIIGRSTDLLLAVDDNFEAAGKGKYVRNWARETDQEILLDAYQVIIKIHSRIATKS